MAYKIKDGYMGQVRHPSFPSGKRRKKFTLQRDADTWERDLKDRLNGKGPQDMALEILSDEYLDIVEEASSKVHYLDVKRSLARFLQWLDYKKGLRNPMWSQLDTFLTQQYFLKRAKEQSKYRANKERSHLNTFCNLYVNKVRKLEGNPFVDCKILGHNTVEQTPPTKEEVDRLLLVAKGQDRAILEAYLGTAARRSEIYRWTWKRDIRLDQRLYRLGTMKTGGKGMEYQWLPMNDDLHNWLVWWKINRPLDKPYVFYSLSHTGGNGGGRGNAYGKQFVKRDKFIYQLSKKAGIDPPLGYHSLRRHVATELAMDGHAAKSIQRFLRHKHLATTEKYIGHVNIDLEAMAQSLVKNRHQKRAQRERVRPVLVGEASPKM